MGITQYNPLDKSMLVKTAPIPDKAVVIYDSTKGYDSVKLPAQANDPKYAGVALSQSASHVNGQGDYGEINTRKYGRSEVYASEAFSFVGQECYQANTDGDVGPVKQNSTPIEYLVIGKCAGCPATGAAPAHAGDLFEMDHVGPYYKTS